MGNSGEVTLVSGGMVYDHDGDTDHPPVADILIDGDRIVAIGDAAIAQYGGTGAVDRHVDARGKLVIPGFVNAHYHSHDILLKGCFETIPLETWVLNALPPSYPKRSAEEVRVRTLLGAYECLRSGMTTVQDMLTLQPFDPEHLDTALAAYEEIGIRCVFSMQFGDIPGIERVPFWKELVPEHFHKYLGASVEPTAENPMDRVSREFRNRQNAGPRLSWAISPTSPDFCTPEILERTAELSETFDLPVLMHIYESRMMALSARQFEPAHDGSHVKYLRSVGLTNSRLGLAHSVWMLPEEIDILAETGSNVIINAVGNLKTRSGIPPIRNYIDAGINVGIGCDNCSCGDAQNMFQAMKLFAGLAAVSHAEPGPPTAAGTMKHATLGGAKILGLGGEVGALKPGMKADLSILNLTAPQFVPLNSAARQTVFAESGESVDTVLVDGRVVMENRCLKTIDEGALRGAVEAVMPELREDIARISDRTGQIADALLEAHRRSWATDVGLKRYVGDATG